MDHPFKDGDIHRAIVAFGARSFSILRASDMQMVYDSGDDFEQQTLKYNPDWFNVDIEAPDELTMDGRSDNKGPETESVVVGTVGEQQYAFIGSERTGGFFIYNVTNPDAPYFVDYIYDASLTDISPEGMDFVSAENSPDGIPMLVIGHELSGTISTFSLESLLESETAEENTNEDNTDEDAAGIIDQNSDNSSSNGNESAEENIVSEVSSSAENMIADGQQTVDSSIISATENNISDHTENAYTAVVSDNGNAVTSTIEDILPNTGEAARNTTLLASLLLMVGSVFTVFRRTKKEEL